jgi:hypothetical protein
MTGLKHLFVEDELLRSPAWFPLRIAASGEMTMVSLTEDDYKAASFLDERMLEQPHPQASCGRALIESAAAKLAPRSHYLFHTGHVGSTLVSRLVGANENFLSLREPALLRAIADGSPMNLDTALALFARTWRTTQRAVIKTTSFVNELAEVILAGDDRPAAIFMFTSPLNYLRGILGGPNSRLETQALAPARLRRLVRRLGGAEWRSIPCSEGEQVAMSWLSEMTALHQAALRFESQVLWMNFDAFLSDPLRGLQTIFRALGALPSSDEVEALVTGAMMRQYYDAAIFEGAAACL